MIVGDKNVLFFLASIVEQCAYATSKFDRFQVLKFSDMWKLSKHLFFRIILTTTVNLFFSWKSFDLVDEKKTTQNLKIFTKFRQQLTVFQFLTVKGNVFFLESTEQLGVRNVQVMLAKKFYCLNLTSTTS